jgi:hypothetical protein
MQFRKGLLSGFSGEFNEVELFLFCRLFSAKSFVGQMNTNCAFCSGDCRNGCTRALNGMSRADRFAYLLRSLGTCSESPMYYEDIVWLVQRIVQVSLSYVG